MLLISPAASIDLALSISSLQEMTPDQVKGYLELIDKVADGGVVYLKQWEQWTNPDDGVVMQFDQYPVPSQWMQRFSQIRAGAVQLSRGGLVGAKEERLDCDTQLIHLRAFRTNSLSVCQKENPDIPVARRDRRTGSGQAMANAGSSQRAPRAHSGW